MRVMKDQLVPKMSTAISAYGKDYSSNNVRTTKKQLR